MTFSVSISKKALLLTALYYLYIPLAFFLCGWIKLFLSLPLSIILGVLPIILCTKLKGSSIAFTRRQGWVSFVILSLWVILSGIGGFVWQNPWDHSFRNAVFNDLVTNTWPVISDSSVLTYYIGYWLPSAAVAKVTGLMLAGCICQLLYGIIGVILAFLLSIEMVGSMKLRYLIPFIFFSGLDIVGLCLGEEPLRNDLHIELWSCAASWESNSTLLFWVYNQAIPSWVATMLILNFRYIIGVPALTLCFLTISAPFSVIGLFPLALYFVFAESVNSHNLCKSLKLLFCPTNIISLLGAIPVVLYLRFNQSTETTISIQSLSTLAGLADIVEILVLEILIFVIFLYRQLSRNVEFYILLGTSVLCLFIRMGTSCDFNSRVELPLNYFMTAQIMIYISNFGRRPLMTRRLFLLISSIAVLTPCLEISRSVYQTIRQPQSKYMSIKEKSIFEFELLRNNFVNDSIYNRPEQPLGFGLFKYPGFHEESESNQNARRVWRTGRAFRVLWD